MKLLIILFLISLNTQAQTFDEIFRQKATQLRYLQQQIAALQLHAQTIEKANQIVNLLTSDISDINTRDLTQHASHFENLKITNPVLTPLIANISTQYQKIKILATTTAGKPTDPFMQTLLQNASQKIQILLLLNTLQLTDEQRITLLQNLKSQIDGNLRDAITIKNTKP
ncbi:MAG: hypothetical protein JST68_29300 [Bacteroidetes bacterium]|nr:hypothetical protein [Bacteroidota bacterium]